MKFFVAMSNQDRGSLTSVADTIESAVTESGNNIIPIFVYRQDKQGWTKTELMDHAFDDILSADGLLVEMSTKQVGVGIEMGFARASGMPIIGVRKVGSESSTTMEGTLTIPIIEYTDLNDLKSKLIEGIRTIQQTYPEADIPKLDESDEATLLVQMVDSLSDSILEAEFTDSPVLAKIDGGQKLLKQYLAEEILIAMSIKINKYADEGDSEISKKKVKMIRDYIESNRFVAEQEILRRVEQLSETHRISREDSLSMKKLVIENFWQRKEGDRVVDRVELLDTINNMGEQELYKNHAERA